MTDFDDYHYPRSLREAFGPHHGGLHDPDRMDWQDRLAMAGSVLAGVAFALLMVMGVAL